MQEFSPLRKTSGSPKLSDVFLFTPLIYHSITINLLQILNAWKKAAIAGRTPLMPEHPEKGCTTATEGNKTG